jgi:hypothetical protein
MTFTLRIVQDEDPINPRLDFDNLGKMICFHRRYNLGDEHNIDYSDCTGWDDLEEHLTKEHDAAIILPLFLYDHSGLTLQTTPFSCPWDSGQIGFIYMDRTTLLNAAPGTPKILTKATKVWAARCLLSEVNVYDQYLTGDVWGYVIEDSDGHEVESCWGFYGEAYCKAEGEDVMAHLMARQEAA